MARGRRLRLLRRFSILLFLIAVALAAFVVWQLLASRAQLDGDLTVSGISAPLEIQRDAQGLPTISGENRRDIAFGLGFLHAQERGFQMDLMRRASAGELSALVGSAALNADRAVRVHQFRRRANAAFNALPESEKRLLQAYSDGVNSGMAALGSKPFEYWVLRAEPEPWQPADTFLVLYNIYLDLQPSRNEQEITRTYLKSVLPGDWFRFLLPDGGRWDAPLSGDGDSFAPASIPETPMRDLLAEGSGGAAAELSAVPQFGSNNWAVTGARTADGRAVLANDMHLGLRVPNIWYRASWPVPGSNRMITGATLPGTPVMVVGSNEHVAWGFTNSNADFHDSILLETRRNDSEYLTPDGWRPIRRVTEQIRIKGEAPATHVVRLTRWGPIIGRAPGGELVALRWAAHDTESANLNLVHMETADSVSDALALAPQTGISGQNLMLADRSGQIAWTIMGRLPNRFGGFDGRESRSWADGQVGWSGYRGPGDYPVVDNPEEDALWSANARMVDGTDLNTLGWAGYDLGARQQQIRDALRAGDNFTETDMLALQRDHRALFLTRWRELLLAVLSNTENPALDALHESVRNWSGHADSNDVGYRVVRAFRKNTIEHVAGRLLGALTPANDELYAPASIEERLEYPVWRLITEQPTRHVPPDYESWHEFLGARALDILNELTQGGAALSEQTWGEANRLDIAHPLADSLPLVGRWLRMPDTPMSGDDNMPYVQFPSAGASQRLVVSPGREQEGLFQMATGQSAHPLSPFFMAGHWDWVHGFASPLLAGQTTYQLNLVPEPNE